MPSKDQLETALINADAAGDHEAATVIANALKNGQFDQPIQQTQQPATEQPKSLQDSSALDVLGYLGKSTLENIKGGINYPFQQIDKGVNYLSNDKNGNENIVGKVLHPIGSAIEAGSTLAVNAIPMVVASGIEGLGAMGDAWFNGKAPNAGESLDRIAKMGTVYNPEDPLTQSYLKNIGKVLEPFSAAPAVSGELNAINNIAKSASVPEYLGAMKNQIKSPLSKVTPPEVQAAEVAQINRGAQSKSLATKMVDPLNPNKTIDDPQAIAMIDNGLTDSFAQAVKQLDPVSKKNTLEMLNVISQGKDEFLASRFNRPSDIVGKRLLDSYKFVDKVNETAGKEIDAAANKLTGQIDATPVIEQFKSRLADIGVKLDQNNKPIFSGSDTMGKDKTVLNSIITRLREANGMMAQEAHRIKRFIDRNVTYGKTSEGGISNDVSSTLKELRTGLDDILDTNFPEYNQANIKYKDTIEGINDFQDAEGKTINLYSEGADEVLGTRSRAILSNVQGRSNMKNAIKKLDAIANKYGGNFNDDPLALAAIADELETYFKVTPRASLGGELSKAETAKSIAEKGVVNTALDKGLSVFMKSEEKKQKDAMKAMRQVLLRDIKKGNQ